MSTHRRFLIIVALMIAVFGGSLWGARLFASSSDRPLAGPPACSAPECVIYDLSTQVDCWQVDEGRTGESRWGEGLSTQVDQELRGGEIVAYKIRWSNGYWSDWY